MPLILAAFVVALVVLGLPHPAAAYIGPGAGLSVIGTAVAFVSAIFFAILGFIWYPVKRLIAAMKRGRHKRDPQGLAS
jgi:hypothetical protein